MWVLPPRACPGLSFLRAFPERLEFWLFCFTYHVPCHSRADLSFFPAQQAGPLTQHLSSSSSSSCGQFQKPRVEGGVGGALVMFLKGSYRLSSLLAVLSGSSLIECLVGGREEICSSLWLLLCLGIGICGTPRIFQGLIHGDCALVPAQLLWKAGPRKFQAGE